ncbi:hypothetical protein POM88_020856 [Heracleum sosnowskyi]|uniref:Uncharacterized protein n=1 Tax=Heracleum sosnowskyi TaxID=360622 RepID=A0AAD8ICR9_9APIA|nr:hypothetical protein POM88_020856 [Heracleum sosnowskyi]
MVEWRGPIKRANSAGLFGSTPSPSPIRIDISNGVIMHNKAKKTLLGIVRAFWPVGAYTWTDINDKYPDWVEKKVIEEFYKFYRHQRGQSRRGSMRTIAGHEVEKILTDEKHGVPPTRLEVWDRSHTKVGKEVDENGQRVYTSAAAKRITLKYAKILEENGFDPAQADKVAEPFQWWYQAKAKEVLDDISDKEGDVTDISESDDEGDVAGATEGAGADAGATDDAEGDVEGEDSDTEGEDGESDGESEAEKGEGSAGEEED